LRPILIWILCGGAAMGQWHPIWDGPLTRELSEVPGLAASDDVYFRGMIKAEDYYVWDTFMAFAERYYAVTELPPIPGYAAPSNLWNRIAGAHYNTEFPAEYNLTNVFYLRWFEPLPVIKTALATLGHKYTSKPRRDLFGSWTAYYSTPVATNPATGQVFYPNAIPSLSEDFFLQPLWFPTNIPPNFFSVHPVRGAGLYGEGITNYPGVMDGYTTKDYGWLGVKRWIEMMDEHYYDFPPPYSSYEQEGRYFTPEGSGEPPLTITTNYWSEALGLSLVLDGVVDAFWTEYVAPGGEVVSYAEGNDERALRYRLTNWINQVAFVRVSAMELYGVESWTVPVWYGISTSSPLPKLLDTISRPVPFGSVEKDFNYPDWFNVGWREREDDDGDPTTRRWEIDQSYQWSGRAWLVRPDFQYK
jgi:hypothetical protein